MNLTPTSEKLISEFDRATINWGWCQCSTRSTPEATHAAEKDYLAASVALRGHVAALERKVRRLKQELRALQPPRGELP